MKKLYIISLFLITLLALGVSADKAVTVSVPTITEKPSLGFSGTITVKNTGDENAVFEISLDTGQLGNFNINLDPSTLNLSVDESVSVWINGTIPDNIETTRTGTQDGTTFSGTIKVKSGNDVLDSTPLNIIAESALDFKKIKASGNSLDFDENIDEISPGDTVKFTGEIENLFNDGDEDIEIENVEITITIEGIDDEGDDDLEEEEDVGDIKADDEESFSIEFELAEDLEAEGYDVIILVEGEDENGATHFIRWELTLEVEKDKHDIWITKSSVSPSKIDCSRNIKVDVELKNQGEKDEDEVVLRIESSALDIDYEDTSIPDMDEGAYDEDTEYSETYSFEISDKVKAGTYPILIKVYYDTDTLSDSDRVEVTVGKCSIVDEEEPEEEEEDVIVVTPPLAGEEPEEGEEGPEIITSAVTETTEVSLFQSNTYLMLLVGAVGIAVIVIIVMIIILTSMRKKSL